MLTLAATAILADAYTTYAALTSTIHGYGEHTPAVAALIASHGAIIGLAFAAIVRMLVFTLVAMAATIWHRAAPALIAAGLAGAAFTWLVALQNVWVVTHP